MCFKEVLEFAVAELMGQRRERESIGTERWKDNLSQLPTKLYKKCCKSEATINTLRRQSQYALKMHVLLFICALPFSSGQADICI